MQVPPLAPSAQPSRKRSVAALALAVVGLAASLASLVDYLGASPAFCAETGCATVRESAWSHPLGVPMPALGVAFFAAAIGLGFVEAPRLRRTLAVLGALGAVLLIGVQAFAIGAWCKLCLVADVAALGHAIAVLSGVRSLRLSIGRAGAAMSGLAAAVAGLALWTRAPVPEAPPPSSNLPGFVETAQVPGVATVVEVVDFECPFCRRMQERLVNAVAHVQAPVRVVRKMLPLKIHPHSMPAALAYCCADA
ncbi:MAG TPA: vitamin K epoxide reductase family protein, partial [Kofleriaceae bacterium]